MAHIVPFGQTLGTFFTVYSVQHNEDLQGIYHLPSANHLLHICHLFYMCPYHYAFIYVFICVIYVHV